jgi:hypothetical protein
MDNLQPEALMACYDDLPREVRDQLKEWSWTNDAYDVMMLSLDPEVTPDNLTEAVRFMIEDSQDRRRLRIMLSEYAQVNMG